MKRIMFLALLIAAIVFFFTAPTYYPSFLAAVRTLGFAALAGVCGFVGAITA